MMKRRVVPWESLASFFLCSGSVLNSVCANWRESARPRLLQRWEIILMLWLGYEIGRSFGWKTMDALFLGAMLAISSTTIIVKALDELGLKRERFAQVV